MDLRCEPLQGRFVRLEPYAEPLKDEVRAALDVDPDAWSLFARPGHGEHFDAWWADADRLASEDRWVNYAVRRLSDGRVVGTTSFLRVRPEHRGVEIGATVFHPEVRGGVVNPEAKLLMLGHGFACGAVRVEIVTDLRNRRSQAAIAKLGAVREGVLRKHKVTWTGHVRDTVVFSVTDEDWPAVRAGLEARLARWAAPEEPTSPSAVGARHAREVACASTT